jgi:hypothetical protein
MPVWCVIKPIFTLKLSEKQTNQMSEAQTSDVLGAGFRQQIEPIIPIAPLDLVPSETSKVLAAVRTVIRTPSYGDILTQRSISVNHCKVF